MAERRMFSQRITRSARFLKMPLSSQALYYHLGMSADDDGIVEAYMVISLTGAAEDDLRILEAKQFVKVLNADLVTYIIDWTENNKIRADRKKDSIYLPLLVQMLPDVEIAEKRLRADVAKRRLTNGQPIDNQWTTNGQPMDSQWTTNGLRRLGKDSIVEDSIYIPENGDGVCAFDAPNGTPNVDNSATIEEQPAPMAAQPGPKRKSRKKADRAETPDFIRFYTEYPRHEARAAAWEAWAKLDPSPELVETIIDHVKRRKTTAWRGVEKQHIPHPSTFINQRRWTDEITSTAWQPSRVAAAQPPQSWLERQKGVSR